MAQGAPDVFPPNAAGIEALARELGQSVPSSLDVPAPGTRSRPTLWGNLVVAGAVLVGVTAIAFVMLGGKP